jgi:hypothetical protein
VKVANDQEKTAARQAAEITREAVPGIRSNDVSLRAMAADRPMFAAIQAEMAKLEAEPEAGG